MFLEFVRTSHELYTSSAPSSLPFGDKLSLSKRGIMENRVNIPH
jgi:hypothetical protein